MPITIKVGGGAAALGSGLGEGTLLGYKNAKEEQEAALEAEEANKVTTAMWRSKVAEQEKSLGFEGANGIDANPGRVTFLGGKIPAFLNPGGDPDEIEFDGLVRQHETAMEGITNPKNRLAYAKVAMEDMTKIRGSLDGRKLEREIKAGLETGHVTQEEAGTLMSMLQQEDADRSALYGEFRKMRSEKKAVVERRATGSRALIEAQRKLAEAEAARQAAGEGVDKDHWENVSGLMQEFIAGEIFDFETDPDGWDAEAALKQLTAIKNMPNQEQMRLFEEQENLRAETREQQYKLDMEAVKHENDIAMAKLRAELEAEKAKNKVETDKEAATVAYNRDVSQGERNFIEKSTTAQVKTDDAAAAAEKAALGDELAGLEKTLQVAMEEGDQSDVELATQRIDEFHERNAAPEPDGVQGQGAPKEEEQPDLSPKDKTRQSAYKRLFEGTLRGEKPFEGMETQEDLDRAMMDTFGDIITASEGDHTVKLGDKGGDFLAFVGHATGSLKKLRKENPALADKLEGKFLGYIEQYEAQVEWIENGPRRQEEALRELQERNQSMGAAAWGGA